MQQNELSNNLSKWKYVNRYSDWMYHAYSDYIGKHIFDVGAGIGRMVSYYLPQEEKVVATDIFQKQVDYMNEVFSEFSAFSARKIDILKDDLIGYYNSFDTVLCINVLEHLKDDELAMVRMYELLCKNGYLIIMVPAFQKLFCQMDTNVSHYRRYDGGVLKKMAQKHKYNVVHNGYFNVLGIIPYYLKGKIKKNTSESFSSDLNVYSGKIYNIAASILEPIEKIFPPHFGLSELIVIQKV